MKRVSKAKGLPACDESMVLVEEFAQLQTEYWKVVTGDESLIERPEVIGIYITNPWIAFADHSSECDKSNEC